MGRAKAAIILVRSCLLFICMCSHLLFFFFVCLLCSISSKGLYNALYPRATLQASLNTCCKAGFVMLLKTTGFDVAKKLSTSVRAGSAAQQGMDFDLHIQILRQSKRFKTDPRGNLCGYVYLWSCQDVSPSNHASSHFLRGWFSPSSLVLPPVLYSWTCQLLPHKTASTDTFSSV